MADDEAPEVDPRFDPVFQRGYDPAVHSSPVRRSVLRARVAAPPPEVVIPPMPLGRAEPAAPAPATAPVDNVEVDVEEGPPRRNPWLLALVLTSAGFLVAAVALMWSIGQRNVYSFSGTPGAPELMLQQLSYMVPPALIVAGVLGLMLRVALGAIRAGRA